MHHPFFIHHLRLCSYLRLFGHISLGCLRRLPNFISNWLGWSWRNILRFGHGNGRPEISTDIGTALYFYNDWAGNDYAYFRDDVFEELGIRAVFHGVFSDCSWFCDESVQRDSQVTIVLVVRLLR